jgi:hypothetical protein
MANIMQVNELTTATGSKIGRKCTLQLAIAQRGGLIIRANRHTANQVLYLNFPKTCKRWI